MKGSLARASATSVALLLALLAACSVGEAPPAPGPAIEIEGPAIRDGLRDPAEARRAAELLVEGESALQAGDAERAFARASEIDTRYAEATGSARALWLGARALRALGRSGEAAEWAGRYLLRIDGPPESVGEVTLFGARTLREAELPGAVEALFRVDEAAGRAILDEAVAYAAALASEMTVAELRDLVIEAPAHPRILPPFLGELGLRRLRAGAVDEAQELGQRGLALSPGPELSALLQGLVDGRIPGETGLLGTLGTLLPETGSPSLRELAREIRDGVELAVTMEAATGMHPVRVQSEDDRGDAGEAGRRLAELERAGAFGVVGPLSDALVDAVARGRTGPVPILSPTARVTPAALGGVLSLTGVDPGAAEALAQLVAGQGVRGIVLFHARTSEMEQEAAWFREAFTGRGGAILRTITYAPGTTDFPSEMRTIVQARPEGLVLFIPPEHIDLVGPQIAYHGVDDLPGLQIFGSDAWSSEGVLENVNPRHTEGVFTISARVPDEGYGPGWDAFVVGYEEHFRRTLRSPIPALGYDAARILIRAAREGGGTPEGTALALGALRDFPGATGLLSVVDGRIRRAYLPVRIENRRLVPLAP